MQQILTDLKQAVQNLSPAEIALVAIITLVVWFLPTIISLFRMPKHAWKVFLINIPLGFTVISWTILFLWSISPVQTLESLKQKLAKRKNAGPTKEEV